MNHGRQEPFAPRSAAARGRCGAAPISLFPFLSILACVIGTLILLIAALAIGQMGTPAQDEDLRRAETHAALKRQIKADRLRIEELRKSLPESDADPVALRAELDKIEKAIAARTKEQMSLSAHQAKLDAEKETLEQRLAQAQKQQQELQTELTRTEQTTRQRSSVSVEGAVKVMPSRNPGGQQYAMRFVEAHAGGLTIFEKGKRIEVPGAAINQAGPFQSLLQSLSGKGDHLLVFLLRDDGVGTFNLAKRVANGRNVFSSEIPLVGQGRVDLSRFE